ncbi:MAG TPA: hypothetical protein VLU43_07800 [Anaeromyxobacteraceae bacterium]|nr:hypothetical protein [Anaeromyxobacteraceae bacterium]
MKLTIAMLLLAWVVGPAPAAAGPGDGIRIGGTGGRLHPYLELEPRYDSNVYLADPTTGTGAVGDFIIHFRPGLRLDIPGDPVKLTFDGALDWAQYTGAQGATSGLSHLYAYALLGVMVNEHGTVSLDAGDDFWRTNNSPSMSLGSAVITNFNTLHAKVPWTPGGGALVLTTTGTWVLESFEPYYSGAVCDPNAYPGCSSSYYSKLGYNELRATEAISWKFLPRTSAVFEAEFFDRIPVDRTVSVGVDGLRVRAGATGLVTAHFAATLKAGYGDTLHSAGVPYGTWLLTAEGEWIGNELMGAKAGYVHDLGSDPGNEFALYDLNRAYADGRLQLTSGPTLELRADWERRDYHQTPSSTLPPGANAQLLHVQPSIEGELTRWLKLAGGYTFTKRMSHLPTVTTPIAAYNYSKNEVWVRATFTY